MRNTRYSAVAIVLHWTIAAAIFCNLGLGWWMHRAIETAETQSRAIAAFQLHKSLGLTILVLSLLRLVWRQLHRPPALPHNMPALEKLAAKATHWAFYILMIAVPLSGWTYVSAQWRDAAPLSVPTLWFGLFQVPHLFDAQNLNNLVRNDIADRTFAVHFYLAWSMAGLSVLHVAAALKHHFLDRDAVLSRMLPTSTYAMIGGVTALLVASAALLIALLKTSDTASLRTSSIGDLPGATWSVNEGSEITFSGVQGGIPFTGRFTRWRAGIQFDPDRLDATSISAVIETGSATDGIPLHDQTLPQSEWFDVARYPAATFRSTEVRALGVNRYEFDGRLIIKERELAVSPFSLTVTDDQLAIGGRVKVSRKQADLGMASDPQAAYVSNEIEIDVQVSATRVAH